MGTPEIILNALAERTRFRLLIEIGKGPVCACFLPKIIRRTQPAVSQHLKSLLNAGLVQVRKTGAKRIYAISGKGKKVLGDVRKW